MNEYLKKSLHVLFHMVSPQKILTNQVFDKKAFKKDVIHAMNKNYEELTGNEVENIVQKLSEMQQGKFSGLGVFAPLFKFACNVLELHNGSPVVKFEQLLAYREVSLDIGSDLIVCAFLAYDAFEHNRQHNRFDFPTALPTNNTRLQNMLKEGLAENHFHLKGSAHSGGLSWIYLMNNVKGQSRKFKKLEDSATKESFRIWVYHAAAIRAFLFKCLKFPNVFKNNINTYRYDDNGSFTVDLQKEIDLLKILTKNDKLRWSSLDYAIMNTATDEENAFMAFSGEREFLYNMFYAILNENETIKCYANMFYFYLLVCIKLHGILIQNNKKVGFENFSDYQDKKSLFFKGNRKFEDAQIAISFSSVLGTNDYNIKSLEARIVPDKTKGQIVKQIRYYDQIAQNVEESKIRDNADSLHILDLLSINKDYYKLFSNEEIQNFIFLSNKNIRHNYFYVAHFPKKADKSKPDISWYIYCRHNKYRKEMEKEALAIAKLRNSGVLESRRIFGIDACSNEIGCRPEVFAQSFRYLKNHHVNSSKLLPGKPEMPSIRITYHVGEDFLDIADGMRAVDEAINFLGLSHGDRIGHGTVLGIDADYWYQQRNYSVVLPRQDLLDNCAWMLSKLDECSHSDIPAFTEILNVFRTQYNYVYMKNFLKDKPTFNSINYNDYMDSWRLRGDNPYIYYKEDGHCEHDDFILRGSYFGEPRFGVYAKNKPDNEELNEIRTQSNIATTIYREYHFNQQIRKSGSEIIEYHITQAYISAIKIIQKYMREYVAHLDIGIECNPSSNLMIGGFKRYDKHPILTFNNYGLGDETKNPQMFVSINTDDQGIFDTSLENEYALIASALNREVDDENNPRYTPTQIYNYLDNIRKMGIEQSFNYMEQSVNL